MVMRSMTPNSHLDIPLTEAKPGPLPLSLELQGNTAVQCIQALVLAVSHLVQPHLLANTLQLPSDGNHR